MSDNEIAMIVSRLDRIDKRIDKLAEGAITWRTLLGVIATMAAIITAIITGGNALWGG